MSTQMIKKKLYFAHPIPTYNTQREKYAETLIHTFYPTYELINPGKAPGRNMQYYLNLVSSSDMLVFMALEDGMIGRGTYREVTFAQALNQKVIYLNTDNQFIEFRWTFDITDQHNWKRYARVRIV